MTIRDCYSWINSVVNQHLNKPRRDYFDILNEHRYNGFPGGFGLEEESFKMYSKYPLGAYFSYWNWHISQVLKIVPSSQLLVIRMNEIEERIPKLADFLSIPTRSIKSQFVHSYKAAHKKTLENTLIGTS